jgi:hypothetical protein
MNWPIQHCTVCSRIEPLKVAAPEGLPFDHTDGRYRAGDERRALVGLNQLLDLNGPAPINSSVWSTN